jgi:hypothetical protein
MTLDEFTAAVIARLPATASWRFFGNGCLLVASRGPAWITYDIGFDRWSVALDGGTYPLNTATLDGALAHARRQWRATLLVAHDLDLLPWTPHPQTAPETRETETT